MASSITDLYEVTNFKEFGTYVQNVMTQNLTESMKNTRKSLRRGLNRCRCGKNDQVDALDDSDDEKAVVNDPILHKTALQETTIHMGSQRKNRRDSDINEILVYYLNLLLKNENTEKLNMKFVQEMIDSGINLNYKDAKQESALFKAVRLDNEELVKLLLDKEVDFKLVNTMRCNVFHMCARNKTANIMRQLASKFSENELESFIDGKSDHEKQTPLHFAAKEDSRAVVECLIVDYSVNKEATDYKSRTALFIAAEYNRKSMVKLLMSLKCYVSFSDENKTEVLTNERGQTALYWITTKMPDVARDALDQLYEPNPYLRKDKHFLAPLEPRVLKKQKNDKYVIPKSVLSAIVESNNLDLIMHPTILCLISLKWKLFGRIRSWIEFLLTILYVAVWITFGMWVPYNKRYEYNFNTDADRFRLCLFIIGIFATIYLIFSEMKEVYNDYRYQKKANDQRKRELEDYENDTKNLSLKTFVKEEEALIKRNNIFKILKNYFFDVWNLYDWVLIILLLACIGTHIDDIFNHSELKARLHIRLMSVTVTFIALRLLKLGRVIIPRFGTLVMILYYAIADMIIWFILYLVVWLSFSCSFWMLYGGVKFEKTSNEDGVCKDEYATEFNLNHNCTTIAIEKFARYDLTAYFLYRLTFGNALDEDQMNQIDDQLTNPLIGSYIGLTTLVLVNIFIALLSATFNRVFEKAEAYIVFQRALEILSKEKSMSYAERRDHIRFIRRSGSPYYDDIYHEVLSSTDDRIVNLENELKDNKKVLKDMENSLEHATNLLKYQLNNSHKKEKVLVDEVRQLKEIMLHFIDTQSTLVNERNVSSDRNRRPPQFDYLHVSDFASPANVVLVESRENRDE